LIVDLGVDYGFSTIAFARPNIGHVFAIDWFQGDAQTGSRNALGQFQENIRDAGVKNVTSIIADFDSACADWQRTNLPIDLLHIDGDHTYELMANDFNRWREFVRPGGVILLHDTQSFPNDVGKFFREIDMPKFEFTHSSGLGVVCKT
jgi:predicted O-methyltransferase YrrM